MTSTTDVGTRAACLQRLATALSRYHDLDVRVRTGAAATCLAARNRASALSETITVGCERDMLVFRWSWGELLGDASNTDSAAQAIAYVLSARDAQLDQ